jgi:hypothetical protein
MENAEKFKKIFGGFLSVGRRKSEERCILFRFKFRVLFKDAKLLRSSWRK